MAASISFNLNNHFTHGTLLHQIKGGNVCLFTRFIEKSKSKRVPTWHDEPREFRERRAFDAIYYSFQELRARFENIRQ